MIHHHRATLSKQETADSILSVMAHGRAIHKWYHVINARNLAHDFSVSLVHASVVTLAALTGEMAGMCDYVCIIKLA